MKIHKECHPGISSSESSSECESKESDVTRFNRLVISAITRRWSHFRDNKLVPNIRGRSSSDCGLSEIVSSDIHKDDETRIRRRGVYSQHPCNDFNEKKHKSHSNIHSYVTSAGGEPDSAQVVTTFHPDVKAKHLFVPTSTGNFASSVGGVVNGVGVVPRSVPTTPLQLEPTTTRPRTPNNNSSSKLDRNSVKQLTSSHTSVALVAGTDVAPESGDSEAKVPSKARQKKFFRHFPQVGPDEQVVNYYSCALVGDILLQGHLYITGNYFAFYSNVFGYVTKLLIPTSTVLRVEKERLARIIPNAVAVSTSSERYVFGSLLSRDATYRLMTHVVKARTRETPELEVPPPEIVPEENSEYSADSSSEAPHEIEDKIQKKECPTHTVIHQPVLLLSGGAAKHTPHSDSGTALGAKFVAIFLAISAALLAIKLFYLPPQGTRLSGGVNEMYEAMSAARRDVHAAAARDLYRGLSAHLQLMAEVRRSLETLSSLLATDLADLTSQRTADFHSDPSQSEDVR